METVPAECNERSWQRTRSQAETAAAQDEEGPDRPGFVEEAARRRMNFI
jgi:hypothetical protein